MIDSDRTVVTGIGLVTPAGLTRSETWQGLLGGGSFAAVDPRLAGLPVDFACAVRGFDARPALGRLAARIDPVTQFVLVAALEAVADAGLDHGSWAGERVGVVIGNSAGGCSTYEREHASLLGSGPRAVSPLLMATSPVNMNAGYLAMTLGALGPNIVVSTACASGTTALGVADLWLRTGVCDIVVAGGTESFLTPTTMASLATLGALSPGTAGPQGASRPFDAARDGFVAGEGAGVLVLESRHRAETRGHQPYATLLGHGASADGHHATAPHPEGAGVRRAIRQALTMAGLEGAEIDHVNAHGTSTPANDVLEAAVIESEYGRPSVTSVKGAIGHLIAGAGAVEAAVTAMSIAEGLVPPTVNHRDLDPRIGVDVVAGEARRQNITYAVSHSFGFGGQNAVVVLGKAA